MPASTSLTLGAPGSQAPDRVNHIAFDQAGYRQTRDPG